MISCASERDVVTEEAIRRLVDAFYAKVRVDPELGPIFARAIPGDWQPHLNTMYAFWSSVMLTSGRYKGNPVAKHLAVEGITMELFERWLALFVRAVDENFAGPKSEEAKDRVISIADTFARRMGVLTDPAALARQRFSAGA